MSNNKQAKFPVFLNLSKESFAFLVENADKQQLPARKTLIRKGETSKSLFILQEGTIKVQRESKGQIIPLAEIQAPATIGEMGLLGADLNNKRTVTTKISMDIITITGKLHSIKSSFMVFQPPLLRISKEYQTNHRLQPDIRKISVNQKFESIYNLN